MYHVRIEIDFEGVYLFLELEKDSSAVHTHAYAEHLLQSSVEKYFTKEQQARISEECLYSVIPCEEGQVLEAYRISKTYKEMMAS